jgi:ketosteroid isomerase-like protein
MFATMDPVEYLSFLAPDVVYKAGNYDPVVGHEGIKQFSAPMMEMFSAVKHDVRDVWEVDESTVVAEMEVTYTRKDGRSTTIPCLDVIRIQDGKVKSLQAYLDFAPAFS